MKNNLENTSTIPIKTATKKDKFPILGVLIALVLAFVVTFLGNNDVLGRVKTPIEAY